ncbi:sensor histidine kinase [Bacillus sp. B-jedd]|uniref:sensor histidine kinase n=1 Tax=Bacillus sp. B-jedd TaxID=1476857 RepID=UPI00051558B5|nr:ATP-binding protein [Bacillus sp. B-jedd]CEG28868.1 integral membrane sensor signal transduction histidine kinase [Bacillus sp. B-jedd]
MLQTLRAKLLFYLLLVSMIGIVLVSLFIQWGFDKSFNKYLELNREHKIERVVSQVKAKYEQEGIYTDYNILSLMHEYALSEQLYFHIVDETGRTRLNTAQIRNVMNQAMIIVPENEDDWQTESFDLVVGGRSAGTITAIYPHGFIKEESTFLQTIQVYIYGAVALTAIIAILISMIFSKTLTSGLKKLQFAANQLQNHNLGIRIPLRGLPGEVKQLAISFNSLAESLSKEEMLRKQFTGDLAHELRTPLATLRSQIEAFQDGIWEPTPQRLEASHAELMRLVRLVNELEKLLDAENPQIHLEMTRLEAGAILSTLWEMFVPAFTRKGVKLNHSLPDKEEWFIGDRDKVMQILSNVINNALKYTPEGKQVTISVTGVNEYSVGFIIRDEGAGMAEDDIPHIFERFYRGDKSRDRKTGGAGIGLSIVKALMEAHKGSIQVTSKLNKGTAITLWFPREEG